MAVERRTPHRQALCNRRYRQAGTLEFLRFPYLLLGDGRLSSEANASGFRCRKPGARALDNQIAFEIGEHAHQAEDDFADIARRVDAFAQRNQVRTALAQFIGDIDQIAEVSPQPIQPPHDKLITLRHGGERLVEAGALAGFAAKLVGENAGAACCLQRVELQVQRLIVSRYARVTNTHIILAAADATFSGCVKMGGL